MEEEGRRLWLSMPRCQVKTPGHPVHALLLDKSSLGFGSLFGSLLHSAGRISGYFFYEILKTNLKIRTPDFTSHCTNIELGTVSVLKGLLLKNRLNKDYCILLM